MPVVSARSLELAVSNIARYGDTDIFPFPLENHWFHDKPDVIIGLLQALDHEFDDLMAAYPVESVKTLSSVGYTGFRAATQIDPIWNAYLLALVIEIAPDIESARIPVADEMVFSY